MEPRPSTMGGDDAPAAAGGRAQGRHGAVVKSEEAAIVADDAAHKRTLAYGPRSPLAYGPRSPLQNEQSRVPIDRDLRDKCSGIMAESPRGGAGRPPQIVEIADVEREQTAAAPRGAPTIAWRRVSGAGPASRADKTQAPPTRQVRPV